ncbi:MAG: response regulator, partial [Thermoanaerobaculia bacterium]|nr:response regulator [Thermoanaerobaculia bacterium]
TRFGYGCISASNGQSALRLANRYHPDLVLTDLLMPGIDGRELSRLLEEEEETPTPSIVFMTSVYRGESYEGEAMDVYGAAAYLEKPVPMEALRSVLVRLLPSKEESQANLSPSSSEISLKDLPDFDDELMIVKD